MATKDKNLSTKEQISLDNVETVVIGIIRSQWHETITQSLLDACKSVLTENGLINSNIEILEVPGVYELPMASRMLLNRRKCDAVISLGCVIKGDTEHDVYINQAVAQGLMQLALMSNTPQIFGVLTTNNAQQAIDRSGGKHGNKGVEAAYSALKMIALKAQDKPGHKIGF